MSEKRAQRFLPCFLSAVASLGKLRSSSSEIHKAFCSKCLSLRSLSRWKDDRKRKRNRRGETFRAPRRRPLELGRENRRNCVCGGRQAGFQQGAAVGVQSLFGWRCRRPMVKKSRYPIGRAATSGGGGVAADQWFGGDSVSFELDCEQRSVVVGLPPRCQALAECRADRFRGRKIGSILRVGRSLASRSGGKTAIRSVFSRGLSEAGR